MFWGYCLLELLAHTHSDGFFYIGHLVEPKPHPTESCFMYVLQCLFPGVIPASG